ncbi:MAG: MotA/TolQ/ExbB proton channel family protein [Cellvibrionales bacterium]|nr:MotA/TolQ/ExbB proton channel family protein [Cellvibrionales bacterium]
MFGNAIEAVQAYIALGGPVIYLIAGLAFLMWTLVLERAVYYYGGGLNRDLNAAINAWEERAERVSWHAHRVREKLISEVSEKVNTYLPMIKTTVALAPLFGLLGTVTGMINVFEIMAITGGGDARQMATGVFSATVPTLSGMVVAIAGVFANNLVSRKATNEKALLEDHLTMDH